MRKTWEHRRPIIKFKVTPRRNYVRKTTDPITRSKYAQSLWNEGAGWNDNKSK